MEIVSHAVIAAKSERRVFSRIEIRDSEDKGKLELLAVWKSRHRDFPEARRMASWGKTMADRSIGSLFDRA
jgi:hypothetical protein